jgi:hypothetical protein
VVSLVISFLSAFGFRVRGGLDIPFTNKNFPLNKFWWAFIFAGCAKYLYHGDWNFYCIVAIATYMSTAICGWGEACGCALGLAKPDTERVDYADFDSFCDNFHIKNWKLIDHPICWGVVWLTLRGVFLSFFIGLALNNIPFMFTGLAMGIIYALCGWIGRKVFNCYDKTFWNVAEWCFGYYMGLMLCVTC